VFGLAKYFQDNRDGTQASTNLKLIGSAKGQGQGGLQRRSATPLAGGALIITSPVM